MTADELDEIFDKGEEDITMYLDLANAARPGLESKRVPLDLPSWMLTQLDREATRLGVTRQSLITIWLAERLSGVSARQRVS